MKLEMQRLVPPADLGWCYRYEMINSAETYYDEWGKQWFPVIRLSLSEHRILKKTPQGVWVDVWGHGRNGRKFILLTATKKWACPSKAEALVSFIARKTRQRDHLERELSEVNEALAQAKKMKEKMDALELQSHQEVLPAGEEPLPPG